MATCAVSAMKVMAVTQRPASAPTITATTTSDNSLERSAARACVAAAVRRAAEARAHALARAAGERHRPACASAVTRQCAVAAPSSTSAIA